MQKDEDLMSNVSTCALAFRLLRMNGYDVTSGDIPLKIIVHYMITVVFNLIYLEF